jgi:hypothetical protein
LEEFVGAKAAAADEEEEEVEENSFDFVAAIFCCPFSMLSR